jgi:hypothetical protein
MEGALPAAQGAIRTVQGHIRTISGGSNEVEETNLFVAHLINAITFLLRKL